MDGRWKLALASTMLAGLVGCTTTPKPMVEAPPPIPAGKNSVYVPEPTDDNDKKEGPLAASTKLTFAASWVDAVATDPTKPAAERERLLSQSRQVYQEVLAQDPKNIEALIGIGEMYQVTGETDRMNEVLVRATKLHPGNAKVWAWVAVKRSQAKEWDMACDAYARAVKVDPENRMYRIHMGFTLARSGRYEEGYECLSKSMRESEAHYNLAMMMIHNGDMARARQELQMSLRVDPNFSAAGEKLTALINGQLKSDAHSDVRTVGYEEVEPVRLNTPRR
ncbi:MAG TPA: hypothetical protein VHR66_11900 [Gemmataceae bacterium]|nr:hypothetical protein [Gemmataceae bacterium]